MAHPTKAQLGAWRQLGRELDADQMDAVFHMIDAFTDEADEADREGGVHPPSQNAADPVAGFDALKCEGPLNTSQAGSNIIDFPS